MFDSITHPQKRAFLTAYSDLGVVKEAATLAGISREAHYDWKAQDAEYAAAFDAARKLAADSLEDELRGRANKFLLRDGTLRWMLSCLKPDIYGKKSTVEVEHSGAIRHEVDLSALADEELDSLERILSKARIEADAGSDSGGTPETQAE